MSNTVTKDILLLHLITQCESFMPFLNSVIRTRQNPKVNFIAFKCRLHLCAHTLNFENIHILVHNCYFSKTEKWTDMLPQSQHVLFTRDLIPFLREALWFPEPQVQSMTTCFSLCVLFPNAQNSTKSSVFQFCTFSLVNG